MSTIGVYDSGIGGLTTLAVLKKQFKNDDFFYYADNLNHPFGIKSNEELQNIVSLAVAKMKNHCDYIILACNTASTIYKGNDVIRLLPPVDEADIDSSLLMATESTINNTDCKGIKTAQTNELASLIEIQASIKHISRSLDMNDLKTYLKIRLFKFRGVKTVILGCSHYPYCKKQITEILGDVNFIDGNSTLIKTLKTAHPDGIGQGKITFKFSGANEENKYRNILDMLMTTK